MLARLNHPHIVILYDFGELGPERTGADPLFYFLMEYVDGTDLGQLIQSKELKPDQALAIVPQICEALQYAHDQGITHRDIKPANILLDKRGVVKIADFGLAKMIGSGTEETLMGGLTQTGTAMGTPHYMAPEQWEHPQQVDHRADIYALGVVFYEMLTGERPAGVFEPPSKKTQPPVDKKLDGVVMRAMDKNPERRYQRASEINDAVSRISISRKSRQSAAKGVPPNASKRNSPWIALSLILLLGLGGFLLWQRIVPDSKARQPPSSVNAQWINVDFDAVNPANFVSGVKVEDHQLHFQHGVWYPAPDKRFKNVAQRVTLTWRADTENISLCFGPVASERSKYVLNKHFAKLHTTDFGNRYCQIGHFTDSTTSLTGSAKPVNPPINPGDRVELLFATIGEDHYVSLNGKWQHAVQSPLFESPAGYETVVSAYEAALDKYEYLPLDGLSKAEAHNLLGLPSPPSPAKSGLGKSGLGKGGRLRAAGTMMNGRPVDVAKTAAFDDFVDVAGGPDSWVALRASGQTISSDGQADFTGIRKIARSYSSYHCFIDNSGGLRFHPAREITLPASLKGRVIVDAACGSHHGLALLEDGQAVVFGRRYEEAMEDSTQVQGVGTPRWLQPDPAALQNVKGVAVTQTHAATLHHDGTVSVWGWEGAVKWQIEPEMQPVHQIASFHDALHMLDAAGQVWSFPLPRSAHPQQPVGFNGRVKLLGNGAVRLRDHLWLQADGVWRAVEADRPTVAVLQSATLGSETNFALLASIAGAKPFGYALWIEPLVEVEGGAKLTEPEKGRLRAFGTTANGKPHDLTKFAAHDDFVDVAGGWGRWVALRANGQTVSSDGRADSTGIAKIAASFNAEYAFITTKGKLVIPPYEAWKLPAELEQGVVDAALGMQHGIALLEGGRAVVFGARYEGGVGDPGDPKQYGTPRWPAPEGRALEKVQAVAATVTHAATLHEDGTLSLWGWEGLLKWVADPRQKPLRQLRSTEDGFWALDEAGQLWHQAVPRNPSPGQPVYVTSKPSLAGTGVTHLRPRCWRRQNGEWAAHINTKDGMALMKAAGISENTAFSLSGGLFAGRPFASLLWIEPVGAASTR